MFVAFKIEQRTHCLFPKYFPHLQREPRALSWSSHDSFSQPLLHVCLSACVSVSLLHICLSSVSLSAACLSVSCKSLCYVSAPLRYICLSAMSQSLCYMSVSLLSVCLTEACLSLCCMSVCLTEACLSPSLLYVFRGFMQGTDHLSQGWPLPGVGLCSRSFVSVAKSNSNLTPRWDVPCSFSIRPSVYPLLR